ncbi:MAG: ankyrin repeat domain-containing protein [Solirubrobacterales bacterium]|nr:ankyrin repeat domain-containing protein [Solirubrobacterales bacterium]MBV9167808.1 ankyrin repeat domain-containing protein [Solirubrobacterales bacterium]MBV9536426.1 ankyrin repeat domain-containing protein [Solirubrobacterales bacterium]
MDRPVDIERGRRHAKALLRAARAGDPDALARMRSDREPCLADAQHAVAREHGEPSWPALLRHVDTLGRELLDAARTGHAEVVYRLLEQGAPPNARDPESGNTALHLAAARGRLDAIDYLVGWIPVDKHARNAAGHTALGACIAGTADPVVAKVLVSVGLEPEPWMLEATSGKLAAWLRDRVGRSRDRSLLPERFGEAAWSTEVALFTIMTRSPLAETRVVGDGFAVRTGRFDNSRNGVVCSRLPEQHADEQIASVLGWLRERRAPAQWLLGPQTEPPDLRERLERAGCQPERTAVHMAARIADLDLSPKRQPGDLEVTPIHDTGRLAEALDAAQDARLLASLGLQDVAPLRHYAALLSGRTAGVVRILIDGINAEVLELNVNANERRRGIGRALVLHALDAAAAAGSTIATIGPTPATVPFYEALGMTLERYPPDRCYYTPLD